MANPALIFDLAAKAVEESPALKTGLAKFFRTMLPAKAQFISGVEPMAEKAIERERAIRAVLDGGDHQALVDIGLMNNRGTWSLNDVESLQFAKAVENGVHYASTELQPKVSAYKSLQEQKWQVIKKLQGTAKDESWQPSKDGTTYWKNTQTVPIRHVGDPETGQGYLTHYLKDDFVKAFTKDGNTVFTLASQNTNDWSYFRTGKRSFGEADIQEFNRITENLMAAGGLDPKTRAAVELLVGRDKISAGQAIVELRNRAMGQIVSPFAVLKHTRKMNLGDIGAYETDFRKIASTYLHGANKHIAALQTWGANYEKQDMFRALLNKNPIALKYFNMLLDINSGIAPFKYSTEGWQNFSKKFMQVETMTKIGLGFAWIPNITQSFISTLPKVGLWRFMRATAEAFTPDGIRLANKSGFGAIKNQVMHVMAGMPDDMYANDVLSKLVHYHPGMNFFNWINKLNNIVTAKSGEIYLKDMFERAQRGSKWGKYQLERYGIDASKNLDEFSLLKGINNFVTDLQLQRNALADPLWMNDPRFRVGALFKRFSLRQGVQAWENVAVDLMKNGNAMPLLRIAATGVAGGAFVQWSKDMIQRGMGGDPSMWRDHDKGFFQQLLNWQAAMTSYNFLGDVARGRYNKELWETARTVGFLEAQAGTIGGVGDIFGRIKDDEKVNSLLNNVFFQVTPVIVSETYGVPDNRNMKGWAVLIKEFAADMAKNGAEIDLKKHEIQALRRFSPMTSYIGNVMQDQRMHDKAQAKSLKKYYKLMEKK